MSCKRKYFAFVLDTSESFGTFWEQGKRAVFSAFREMPKGSEFALGVIKGKKFCESDDYLKLPLGLHSEADVATALSGVGCEGRTAAWSTSARIARHVMYRTSGERSITMLIITDGKDNESPEPYDGPEGWREMAKAFALAGIALRIHWMYLAEDGASVPDEVRLSMQSLVTSGHNSVVVRRKDVHAAASVLVGDQLSGLMADTGDRNWAEALAVTDDMKDKLDAFFTNLDGEDSVAVASAFDTSAIRSVEHTGDPPVDIVRSIAAKYTVAMRQVGGLPVTSEQIKVLLEMLARLGTQRFRVKKMKKNDDAISLLQFVQAETKRTDVTGHHLNSLLYSLETPGMALREPDSSPPVWKLTEHGVSAISLYNRFFVEPRAAAEPTTPHKRALGSAHASCESPSARVRTS